MRIAVIAELETRFGIRRNYVVAVAKLLAKALSAPRPPSRNARLIVTFDPPNVTYSDQGTGEAEGIVMALRAVFDRVDPYVAAKTARPSHSLQFPPMALQARVRPAQSSAKEASASVRREPRQVGTRRTRKMLPKTRRAGEGT